MKKLSIISLVAMLCLAGCAQPEYWVKGLTLPPGSTVVSRSENMTEIEGEKTQPDQSNGTLTIYFDSTSSWDQIQAHIGGELTAQGFTEMSRELGDFGAFASKVPGLDKMMTATKSFSKEGSGYFVMVSNSKALGQVMDKVLSKLKGKDQGDKPKGEYMLTVVRNSAMKGGSGSMTPTPPAMPDSGR